jgi:S1-C subfamily serine protease
VAVLIGALMTHGRVRRAHIGIAAGVRTLPPRARARHGAGAGLEVVEVIPDGPAARADLRAEDLVVAVNGIRIETISALQGHLDAAAIDREAALTIIRADRELTIAVLPRELATIEG